MSGRESLVFIKHILGAINIIEESVGKSSKEKFMMDNDKKYASVKMIEIIGEAVKNLPESFMRRYASVSWRDIAKTKDKFVHHYFGIDFDTVWEIIKKDIPVLKKQIKEILEKENV